MSTAPGAPVSQLRPGAKIPPNDSPNTHTTRPQPTLATPASLDHVPRAATSSQAPIPTWIHTEAAPAWMGWNDQLVPPQLTTCWTQPGDAAAVGSMTCVASPPAIFGCACRIPSRIQSTPNPTRSSHRPLASAGPPPRRPPPPSPPPARRVPGPAPATDPTPASSAAPAAIPALTPSAAPAAIPAPAPAPGPFPAALAP